MTQLFISHSSQDDAFVRELRWTLADLKQEVWIDSRELRGGDLLWTKIQKAIEEAAAYAVVVSTDALQSKWVGKELRHALDVQKQYGKDQFPVIPLSLNGAKLGVLEQFFNEEPVYLPVSSAAGGVEAAMNPILVAMGKRLPADVPDTPQPKAEPLEELVLEFTDLKLYEQDGKHRATARARLIYEPATPGRREVASKQPWRFIAPIGPIETGELRWYLEKYAVWPSHYFQDRARKVEENLVQWGRLLHEAAMPPAHTANVMEAWAAIDGHAGRRFSVHVNATLEAGAPEADVLAAKEAATLLLGLPWELLHRGDAYLFQGANPTRVRRRLPNTEPLDVAAVAAPIRILLITARPEDEACGYIDHRASALPLVEAMEALGGLVRLRVLSPPTLPALNQELQRAFKTGEPYHVVHFDGHGVYDRRVGLGGLCFEEPQDIGKLEGRRHLTVFTSELGPLLKAHRIPLVFLEACQTAMAEEASESVASDLLQRGVVSVVAMSHSVLVETARRFVQTFYAALARGVRVGDAMLEGQHRLNDDKFRGRIFGVGEFTLHDWFVPVLFQEKEDPQLFRHTPAPQTQKDLETILGSRLGGLPPVPDTGFIGRSRELLALQRLLRCDHYAVVCGQGGEGKTALASEFARWMVRSQQMRRAAFVSVETHSTIQAVLDALGRQLVGLQYTVATFNDLEQAILPVERALIEQVTLLVIDNMESVLLPPFMEKETPKALSEEVRAELKAIIALCERLLKVGDTRLVFTSREPLPAPFHAQRNRQELHQLNREDAVKLVERVLNAAGGDTGGSSDTAREAIEQLVDAVHCHARTLALLAPALRRRGVEATRASLVELMAEMEQQFPGSREHSVFASVELSLRRLSTANRERVRVLGVFHSGFQTGMLRYMMQWEEADVDSLAVELVETGLATPNRYNYLTLNSALCPYLRRRLDAAEHESLTARWVEVMRECTRILDHQSDQNAELAVTLTRLELPNLLALLDLVQAAGDPEVTIALAHSLYRLLQFAGKPRLLARVGQVGAAAVAALGDAWTHAQFVATQTRIEQQIDNDRLHEALDGAQSLLQRARAAGEKAYPGADSDLAGACWLLATVLKVTGHLEQSLPLLDEARQRYEAIVKARASESAERMVSVCIGMRGECLFHWGRLGEAAAAYEEAIRRHELRGEERDIALNKAKLGSVRLSQGRYQEALAAYRKAIEQFTQLDEPGSVAYSWHLTGQSHKRAGELEAAEDAYRKALAIAVRLDNVAEQRNILLELGDLYDDFNRLEEAAAIYQQVADQCFEIRDVADEGTVRNNLGNTLRKLHRLDEARQEIRRAIECKAPFGHAAQLWTSWAILADIETDAGNFSATAEAKHKAIECYLAYRRDGGENYYLDGRFCFAVAQSLLAGDPAAAASRLQQVAADPDLPSHARTFIQALQAIVAGRRDRTLATAPDLNYSMAAEILFLIETLEKRHIPHTAQAS